MRYAVYVVVRRQTLVTLLTQSPTFSHRKRNHDRPGERFILSNLKQASRYVKIPYGKLWRIMARSEVFENETYKVTFLK
jgi:hypothetical protein